MHGEIYICRFRGEIAKNHDFLMFVIPPVCINFGVIATQHTVAPVCNGR